MKTGLRACFHFEASLLLYLHMSRILTALQPTGNLHIGNYFGAIEPLVEKQNKNENYLFIVDYHAITIPQDPAELRKNILYATAVYLAAGVDPEKTILFQQSRIAEHTELAWVLNCLTYLGELERMTQFKDKSKNKSETVSLGLFSYPVLMAADILLYGTEIVPVGDDQRQHVELARDIAKRFNNRYGETFIVPKAVVRKSGSRILALDNPENKMSKSAVSEKSYISLLDDEKTMIKKIKSAVTDSESAISFDPENRKAVSNLLSIFSLVTGSSIKKIVADYDGKGYGAFKEDLAEATVSYFKPLQQKIADHLKDEEELKIILNKGASKASAQAEQMMKCVREKIGITL
jgi:tryptophanyl-tRNA synthetase